MEVPLRELEKVREPIEMNPVKGVSMDLDQSGAAVQSRIDIRGMRKSEAIDLIERLVDAAIIEGKPYLEIVHGKGNGVLRQSVREKLREFKAVKETGHPPQEQGGEGVTIVKLD